MSSWMAFGTGAVVGMIAGCMSFYYMLKNDEPRLQQWLTLIREKRKKLEETLK